MTSNVYFPKKTDLIYTAILIASLSLFECDKFKGKFAQDKGPNPPKVIYALDRRPPVGNYAFVYSPKGVKNVIIGSAEDSQYNATQPDDRASGSVCSFLKDSIAFENSEYKQSVKRICY